MKLNQREMHTTDNTIIKSHETGPKTKVEEGDGSSPRWNTGHTIIPRKQKQQQMLAHENFNNMKIMMLWWYQILT